MWRRKKPSKVDQVSDDQKSGNAKPEICSNCIRLKQYTINPTLYTFYKNNVQKNRISRSSRLLRGEL